MSITTKNKSQKWCEAGSSHVWLRNDNTASVCCALKDSNKFPLDKNSNFQNVMQSPQWKSFIQPLENRPINHNQCDQCILQEQGTGESIRQKINQSTQDGFFLKIDFSNKCNLKCIMCNSVRSTGWKKDEEKLAELGVLDANQVHEYNKLSDKWWLQHEKLWWNTVSTIEISGGEPFYEPMLFEFLEFLLSINKQNVNLTIITNLTLYNKTISDLLLNFNSVQLLCSVDAWQEDIYQYSRGGIYTLKTIKENIKLLSTIVKDIFVIDTLHCVTYDQSQLGKQWIAQSGIKNIRHTLNYVYTPRYLDARSVLPDSFLENNKDIVIPKDGFKKDNSLQQKFVKWITALDSVRNTNILQVRPEFESWFERLEHEQRYSN